MKFTYKNNKHIFLSDVPVLSVHKIKYFWWKWQVRSVSKLPAVNGLAGDLKEQEDYAA